MGRKETNTLSTNGEKWSELCCIGITTEGTFSVSPS